MDLKINNMRDKTTTKDTIGTTVPTQSLHEQLTIAKFNDDAIVRRAEIITTYLVNSENFLSRYFNRKSKLVQDLENELRSMLIKTT